MRRGGPVRRATALASISDDVHCVPRPRRPRLDAPQLALRRSHPLDCFAMTVLRVGLAQLNPTVGDLDGNVAKILDAYDRAEEAGCDIVAFTELCVTGYPPEDL